MKILVTGAAGFIGFHLCQRLLELGINVVGIDDINDYYDVKLKYARLKELGILCSDAKKYLNVSISSKYNKRMKFLRISIQDRENISKVFEKEEFDLVCNLAAQAGVRYSIENPQVYIDSNIQGFLNILECCRNYNISKLVYASSSSVYGNSKKIPFKENDNVDEPISLYAATKKSNELMAYTYSHLYGFKTIGLRFFTVYGPWGRPDMAMFLFTDAIIKNKPIKVFNGGSLSRDFTYIDDIINGVLLTLLQESKNKSKHQIFNIGNNQPVKLLDFITEIENRIGRKAKKEMLPMQPGDVDQTYADINSLSKNFGYSTSTSIADGVGKFIDWYKEYYNVEY